jgi:hypothetical protein
MLRRVVLIVLRDRLGVLSVSYTPLNSSSTEVKFRNIDGTS